MGKASKIVDRWRKKRNRRISIRHRRIGLAETPTCLPRHRKMLSRFRSPNQPYFGWISFPGCKLLRNYLNSFLPFDREG